LIGLSEVSGDATIDGAVVMLDDYLDGNGLYTARIGTGDVPAALDLTADMDVSAMFTFPVDVNAIVINLAEEGSASGSHALVLDSPHFGEIRGTSMSGMKFVIIDSSTINPGDIDYQVFQMQGGNMLWDWVTTV